MWHTSKKTRIRDLIDIMNFQETFELFFFFYLKIPRLFLVLIPVLLFEIMIKFEQNSFELPSKIMLQLVLWITNGLRSVQEFKKKNQHQYMNMFFGILTFFRMYIWIYYIPYALLASYIHLILILDGERERESYTILYNIHWCFYCIYSFFKKSFHGVHKVDTYVISIWLLFCILLQNVVNNTLWIRLKK